MFCQPNYPTCTVGHSNTWPQKVARFIISNSAGYFHVGSVYNLLIFYLKFLLGLFLHIVQLLSTVNSVELCVRAPIEFYFSFFVNEYLLNTLS